MEPVDTQAVQLFSAVLALAALTGAVVAGVSALLAPRGVAWADDIVDMVRQTGQWLVFLVTGGAMFGSLWFSEKIGFAPCKYCWYQRIAMFSLAVLSLVAAIRRDRGFSVYALTGAAVGLAISTYHYLLEWFPSIQSGACSVDVPCTAVWFREFGFVSLAFMAGCAFIATIVVSLIIMSEKNTDQSEGAPDGAVSTS